MTTSTEVRKFLSSLPGHGNQLFTIEEVEVLKSGYCLKMCFNVVRDSSKRNPLAENEYLIAHLEEENGLRVGHAYFLNLPRSRFNEVEEALQNYQSRIDTAVNSLTTHPELDDILLSTSVAFELPNKINRYTRAPLLLTMYEAIIDAHDQWNEVSTYIFAELGLPENHGRPTEH